MEPILIVPSPSGDYPVYQGGDRTEFLARICPAGRFSHLAVIGDENTFPLFGQSLLEPLQALAGRVTGLTMPAGEEHKTRETKALLEDRLLGAGFDRSGCVVAVGGGICLDVAGFTAATYLRGVPWVAVATTLLAQVDASVGGKTGVNLPTGKNLVGAFHPPRAVLLDTAALAQLPAAQYRNGLAEAVKSAVVADAALFDTLESTGAQGLVPLDEAGIRRCVEIKAAVVARDEREAGPRRILNFGHTAGHALEKALGHRLAHGEAVALGMVVEGRAACRLTGFPVHEWERLTGLLERYGLPVRPPCSYEEAAAFLQTDKKNEAGSVRCALPRRLGEMEEAGGAYAVTVPPDIWRAAWAEAGAEAENRNGEGAMGRNGEKVPQA